MNGRIESGVKEWMKGRKEMSGEEVGMIGMRKERRRGNERKQRAKKGRVIISCLTSCCMLGMCCKKCPLFLLSFSLPSVHFSPFHFSLSLFIPSLLSFRFSLSIHWNVRKASAPNTWMELMCCQDCKWRRGANDTLDTLTNIFLEKRRWEENEREKERMNEKKEWKREKNWRTEK